MAPITLQHLELELGNIGALALSQDGRQLFVGRHSSEDQARENIAVFTVDPQSATLSNKRLYRDSDQPLPPTYTTPKPPLRPRAVVTSLLVAPRYRKLYIGTRLEDHEIRPAYLLTIYDLDDAGEIRPETIRSYRAIADNLPNPIGIECMALHPQRDVLYMAGGAWNAVRFYQLNTQGEPIGTAPTAITINGGPKASLAISPDGSRMYLGTTPATLQIVALIDGVPQNPPLRNLPVPELALADTYLRFVHTPQALYAARPRSGVNPPLPGPLYMLPLLTPDGGEFQRVDGFEHTLLTADPERQRLWLLRDTSQIDALTGATLVDGAELVAVATDAQGVPQAEIETRPKLYGQQGLLAAAGADTPIMLTRGTNTVVNYAAHEQVRFTIRRVAPAPGSPPLTLACDLTAFGTTTKQSFQVVEGTLSAPVSLDPYLSNHTDQVALWLTFPPAVSDVEWEFEVQYIGAGAHEPLIKRDRVRGGALVFLVAGYAVVPERRFGMFELFSDHARQYRAAAEAVQVDPADRPEQFVISSYGLSGLQGHAAQLDDGVATLRALGINSVMLGAWGGLSANDIKQRYRDLSAESGVYAPEFYYFFDFIYDGSLKNDKGQTIDQAELESWAAKKAQEFESHTGLPISRLVRFQIADENGWYYPDMLKCFRRENPTLLPNVKVDWHDETKNAAWIKRFQDYVAVNDLILRDFYADTWDQIVPIGASEATTTETRRLFYWSMRFFSDQAALGARRIQAALEAAFRPAGSPPADDRPEHARLHVHTNFSETMDWQWYKPYPNAQGDKNPDQGPDAATGSLDWFDYAADGMPMASKTTYVADYNASAWSFYADLVRSAARRADGRPPAFSSIVPGFSMGDVESGASYKLLALLSRGCKIPIVYAFGPQFFFRGVNSWSENFAAYGPIARATELIGRSERVLYSAQPEHGRVAIHFPGGSRLWDHQQRATFYSREMQPLHAALVHDGYSVDFVDDRLIESGAFVQRGYTTLYLIGPNLSMAAQQTIARWVAAGGTLVVLPGAATADAFNTPTTLLDEVLGLAPRDAWTPLREIAYNVPTFALSNHLQIVDQRWQDALHVSEPLPLRDLVQDPTAPKVVDFAMLSLNGAQTIATVKPRTGSAPERPAITVHGHGKGLAYAYAFFPGWQYWCTATHPVHLLPNILRAHTDRLPRYWSDPDRLLATLPARQANTPRSVVTSHAAVEARRLQSAQGIAIVLLNWTGAPIQALKVSVPAIGEFRRITSTQRGPLSNTSTNKASASVSLPLNDVDVLLLESV